jgi:cation diffusion facilitator CzcD-associated flavoprotein CzcO
MTERYDVVVVGEGQAGLSISHELSHAGVEHVVLERSLIAATWGSRWDSFCLVTPNWMTNLPGQAYAGTDPDGFMPRDDLVGPTPSRSLRATSTRALPPSLRTPWIPDTVYLILGQVR